MITIDKIKKENNIESISDNTYDGFFFGASLDDRTTTVESSVLIHPRFNVFYDKEKYSIVINGSHHKIFQLHEFFIEREFKKILIDATSLGFPEILYLLNAVNHSGLQPEIIVLYVEPEQYNKSKNSIADSEFILSDNRHSFASLPAFSIDNQSSNDSKAVLVTFLGFENSRLGQIIENDDGANYKKLLAHISLPAYKAGWENISIRKHIRYFEYIDSNLIIHPGSNPYAVNELLSELTYSYSKLVITPLGTKPTALGVCIFLINNYHKNSIDKQIGAIYDFPEKSKKRTVGLGVIYTYKLTINNQID